MQTDLERDDFLVLLEKLKMSVRIEMVLVCFPLTHQTNCAVVFFSHSPCSLPRLQIANC